MRRSNLIYIIACALAALAPLGYAQFETPASGAATGVFPGWPNSFEGKPLTPLPLNEMEQKFTTDLPGKFGRFTDGEREIIIRWVTEATRKMHPSSDCFQGLGYTVEPLPVHRDKNNSLWSSFAAAKGNERLIVYEQIHSDSGETWTDVSAWYWSALRHQGNGSWWAITIAEKQP